MTRGGLLRGDQHCTGPIVHARGVACGDASPGAKRRGKLGQLLERRLGPRVLVAQHHDRCPLALWNLDRNELGREEAARGCRCGALLASQREAILVLTR